MTAPDPTAFDEWYESIATSTTWDRLVRQWLDLPDTVESTGLLSGSGLREVRDVLALTADQHLVEVGCGRAGYGLALIAEVGAQLTGVDFSAAALRSATAAAARLGVAGRAQFRLADLSSSGLPAGTADAVLSVDALHFADSVVEALAECRRLLKPGGLLVVTSWLPAGAEAVSGLPARLARMDLERDLAAGGFVDVTVSPRLDWHETEVAFWERCAALDPGSEPDLADLHDEGIAFLPIADSVTRVLAVARA